MSSPTISNTMTKPTWQEACTKKKAAQEALIPAAWRLKDPPPTSQLNVISYPKECGILTEKEVVITEIDDVAALALKLQKGEYTAVEVTKAYSKRSAIAQQLVNCLSEIFYEEALEQAHQLDQTYAKSGPVGPLHGVPVSLKDAFAVKGVELTMGYVGLIGNVSTDDSVLVNLLRQAGAVFYVKTSVPQTLMSGETNNHVFGRCLNPHNRTLTCGGSSGGEGALIALKGSPLGVGSHHVGQFSPGLHEVLTWMYRPAFNGLYGLRPTNHRLPYQGADNTLVGLEAVCTVLGPIARSTSGLVLFTSAVLQKEPWKLDPKVPEIPWRSEMLALEGLKNQHGGKLTFAVFGFDGVVMPHPPILRGLRMIEEALQNAGHEVVKFTPLDHAKGQGIISRIYFSDGGEDIRRSLALSGEPPLNDKGTKSSQGGLSTFEAWQLAVERDDYRKAYLDHWNALAAQTSTGRIDGIINPVAPYTACEHNTNTVVGYTSIWNLLDYPAVVLPVTVVDPNLDPPNTLYQPANDIDQRISSTYTPEKYVDAPVCLQIVGKRYREEELLGLVQVAADALAG